MFSDVSYLKPYPRPGTPARTELFALYSCSEPWAKLSTLGPGQSGVGSEIVLRTWEEHCQPRSMPRCMCIHTYIEYSYPNTPGVEYQARVLQFLFLSLIPGLGQGWSYFKFTQVGPKATCSFHTCHQLSAALCLSCPSVLWRPVVEDHAATELQRCGYVCWFCRMVVALAFNLNT